MHLPLHAQDTTLTNEQAKILDDEFFRSDPLAHFSSRVSMLLETARSNYEASPKSEPEFFKALGLDNADSALKFDTQHRSIQVAIDALSLRHQAAEALIRFIYARVAAEPRRGDAKCTWLAIADSPTRMIEVIEASKATLDADQHRFLQLLFPPATEVKGPAVRAAESAVAWVNHAVWLLTSDELSINAAHNKLKHGLATSARGDVRTELITTPPNEDGTIPTSAFGEGKSTPLFDRPMLTYLSRPPKELRQGLEVTSLRVDLPVVLAETWMMANVYATMFHVAALEHYGKRLPEDVAPYPALVVGRQPDQLIGDRLLGYRSAVTLPPDGKSSPRPSGILFFKQFWPMRIDFESKTECMIVDG
ncbi:MULTISPECIES: hypothetical protein [unclassified Actinomyces]|uniref:hypothetical protein n=1 Tax=unclassified Actinomyces TaxID=2609248 RepID=UPI002017EBEA|nr:MULTISPECIES: hypothetical protein [unclassified Actinomyces]MCL3776629.1 hypothetical protein [Actinomyces sp. AC-20-1]MCL3790275.1 hypothetical protein [Actinomyces sp. 187325]MCL3791908.1 hypothetical protein [Actinomyces sp. 186855]MCL3795071.1 hypothetical protein [Actinomyces sp. 217892]